MPHTYGGPKVPAVLLYGAFAVAVALALLVLSGIEGSAVEGAQLTLTPREVDEAIQIGQTRVQADRTRFHAPYRVISTQPPVDFVDVITPFRRVVLAADARAQIGDRSFGQRQGLEMLAATAGQFDFSVELTFHPLNTFVGMPDYAVAILRGGARVAPLTLDRLPRYGARVEGTPSGVPTPGGLLPGRSQPMLGGSLLASFTPDSIDPNGVMELVVNDVKDPASKAPLGKELARVRIDLGRLR